MTIPPESFLGTVNTRSEENPETLSSPCTYPSFFLHKRSIDKWQLNATRPTSQSSRKRAHKAHHSWETAVELPSLRTCHPSTEGCVNFILRIVEPVDPSHTETLTSLRFCQCCTTTRSAAKGTPLTRWLPRNLSQQFPPIDSGHARRPLLINLHKQHTPKFCNSLGYAILSVEAQIPCTHHPGASTSESHGHVETTTMRVS